MSYLKDELQGFVPVEQAAGIMQDVAQGSVTLRMSKAEPMNAEEKKFSVFADAPGAYWVGEGERIKTSAASWIFPVIKAKKIAVIIPVTREKLNDASSDVFAELRPAIAEAFYNAIDKACVFGIDSPFDTSIMSSVRGSSSTIELGQNGAGKLDLDVSDAMAIAEEAGYDVDGFIARTGIKNALRKLRDANGNQLYFEGVNGKEFYSQPIAFVKKGWDKAQAEIIGGEWKYSIVGVREGITYEVLKEATLQGTLDADGKPLSLAEQDLIAIKATMRIGYLCIKDDAFCAVVPADSDNLGALTVTSAAGSVTGKTDLTVSPAPASGNSYKIKTGTSPQMPVYNQDCSSASWSGWNGTDEVTAATGSQVIVAEVDGQNQAKKAGKARVTAKA